MKIGSSYTSHAVVNEQNTAEAVGSGGLSVFATPAMIALMENAAMNAVAGQLEEGSATVGTLINVSHSRATPLDQSVSATAILIEIDGRRLVFNVSASDNKGIIGEGSHERFIVNVDKFLSKL